MFVQWTICTTDTWAEATIVVHESQLSEGPRTFSDDGEYRRIRRLSGGVTVRYRSLSPTTKTSRTELSVIVPAAILGIVTTLMVCSSFEMSQSALYNFIELENVERTMQAEA